MNEAASEREVLSPERWRRVESIFHALLEAPESERTARLDSECAGDDLILAGVQDLLVAFDEEKRFQSGAAQEKKPGRLGEIIDGYRLDEEIGQGGMGAVYLAHRADGEFEQQVALKLVSPHLRTQFFTERFRVERRILAGLNHPNIPRLLGGGVSSAGDPYLAMEYVAGKPIDRYCDERLLAIPDRIRLFLQVCSTVEYAHRNLVVHRDLKPANLLVTSEGTPRLLDFGASRLLLNSANDHPTTRFHPMTLRYASPEQLRGEPVSTSMDVYSLGVMLYELLAGAWPFGDPNSPLAGLERAVRHVEPGMPRSLITDEAARRRSVSRAKLAAILGGDLSAVLLKAIDADPRRRYTSVEQLSGDLRRWLAGQPVLAREQTLLYRGARYVQRHRWRLAGGVLLLAVLGFFMLVALREYRREQRRMVQVRNLSQSLLSEILNEVGKLPGSMKARLLIVDRARRNLDQLLPEAPNDPDLRRMLAASYLQLGDIQGKPFTVSVGDAAGAIESYRKADALATRAGPADWEMLAVLVRARRTMAQIEARAGRYSEAVTLLRSALDPAKRVWHSAPANSLVDGRPAAAVYAETSDALGYTMLKSVERTPGDLPQLRRAQAELENTVHIAEQLQAAHPGMPNLVGPSSQHLGFVLEALGNATGDMQYFRDSVAAHRRAAESVCSGFRKDGTPQTQRNCADGLGELSWALHRAGEGPAAVEAAGQALTLMAPVSKAEPDSVEAQQDLVDAYLHLGAAENTAGSFGEAIAHLRTAESLLRPLLRDAGDDPLEAQGLYAHIERELGEALLAAKDFNAAGEALARALAAARRSPKSAYWIPYIQREIGHANRPHGPAASPGR